MHVPLEHVTFGATSCLGGNEPPVGEPVGSLILFEAETLDAARTLAARDPYVVEGIFQRHEVHELAGAELRRGHGAW